MNWIKENIEDDALLYFFVHYQDITYSPDDRKPLLKESALLNTPNDGPNKSCDWSKYASPKQTWELRRREHKFDKEIFKDPNHYFVYSHTAGEWRNNQPIQIVEHDPIQNIPEKLGKPNNRAHSIIIGHKEDLRTRVRMARLANWEIRPPINKSEMKKFIKNPDQYLDSNHLGD